MQTRRIWLRPFNVFNPEEAGYIGWTKDSWRARMLGQIQSGDLFLIYGTSNSETAQHQRNRVLGFLQIEARAILDSDKCSTAALLNKKSKGWAEKWTFAVPVVRAWRVEESILLTTIAHTTYQAKAGQPIAVWNPRLLPEEVTQALKIKVTEVNVFGEPPINETFANQAALAHALQPSKAFPHASGDRIASYIDGPTRLYLAIYSGNGHELLGIPKSQFDNTSIMKIGVSNNLDRRLAELNSGFPPEAKGKWKMELQSEPFESHQSAEIAEQAFKDSSMPRHSSLGGEFFRGLLVDAQVTFASISGVSRFRK